MKNFQQQLFGTQSFLEFTLDGKPIEGKPHLVIDNSVEVELWDSGVLYFHPQGIHCNSQYCCRWVFMAMKLPP